MILIQDDSEIRVSYCFFINNIGKEGGSIICCQNSKIKVINSTFDENGALGKSGGTGGALAMFANAKLETKTVILKRICLQ